MSKLASCKNVNKDNSHESKASGASGLIVLHHHTVNDFTIATEVSLQAVLGRLPAEASDEELPKEVARGRGAKQNVAIKSQKIYHEKKLSHHQKNERSGFHF